ncbi:AAA family ATPase [Acinetobacter sp. 256-1]|uniref:ATP-dependent DNA helicase n=1 Tax=Acinetobacter sp. 256-1 TaxID=2746721 RepID=UPI002577B057|nr:AAA family ATPase [Acinetobacter sp. 256-1]MDM1757665.1 AAA family ATPase [Acinetobacter sp. 256-1]
MDILKQITNFLTSTSNALIITGSAGTGKTSLIKEIVTYLNNQQLEYYLLAPTGRAAHNLQNHVFEVTEVSPTTIHSFLYKKDNESAQEVPEILRFSVVEEKVEENAVVIIDEASMLSHEATSEKDFLQFGSGNLFKDLTDYLNLSNSNRKLLLVGDPCQLPPINVSQAEVLNIDYLKQHLKTDNIEHIHLNEVHRQLKGSAILKTATALRDKLQNKEFLQLPIDIDHDEIHHLNMDDALEKYLWNYGNSAIFLSYTNKDVHYINLRFRELLNLNPKKLEKKERLILMKNSWVNSKNLYNGDFFIIENLGGIESFKINVPQKQENPITITLEFQDIELRKEDEFSSIKCKILHHKIWNEENETSTQELQALVIHFKQRYPHLQRGTSEYKQAIQNDPYINALYLRFGYAMTCHKAQGGEWDNLYINLARPQNDLKTLNGFKWTYTALTRSKKYAYLINCPVNNKAFDPLKPFDTLIAKIQSQLNQNGFQLISTKPLEYELQLFIQKNNINTSFKIYRNGKMKITRLMAMQQSIYSEELEVLLNTFVDTSLVEN